MFVKTHKGVENVQIKTTQYEGWVHIVIHSFRSNWNIIIICFFFIEEDQKNYNNNHEEAVGIVPHNLIAF